MIFYSSVRAVYGQLNGGGIALALAADWIVVP
jgi:enoyl-CoA hydratase/carnithine racemase